jgi:hypothetical protein
MSRMSAGTFDTSGVLQPMKKMIRKQLNKINCRRNNLIDVIIYAGINLITFDI